MKFRYRQSLAKVQVDREAGILRGVAVCTMGAAKGHGVLIDDTTLDKLIELGDAATDGVRVKFNSATFTHGEGSVVGRLIKGSLKKDGDILRGDLQVVKSSPGFAYLFDLAESQPGTIGLSVEFEGEHEDISGVKYARPETFDAAAVVDMPAANPLGLFSAGDAKEIDIAKIEKEEKPMELADLKAALNEALTPINARLQKLEEGQKPDPEEEPPDVSGMSSEQVTAELTAAGVEEKDPAKLRNKKVATYRKLQSAPVTMGGLMNVLRQGGGMAVPHNGSKGPGPGEREGDRKNAFMSKVDEIAQTSTNGDKAAAMRLATRNFPTLHKEWLQSKGVVAKQKTQLA